MKTLVVGLGNPILGDGRWLAALWAVTLIQIGAAFWFGDWVVMHLGGFIESVRSLFS